VDREGINGEIGVVAGEVRYCHNPVQGMMPVEGIWCPEGSMGWCVVVDQPLHQGEVDQWCWGGWGRFHGELGKGKW